MHILKLIYGSLIQSKLLYSVLLWGTNLNDIMAIQMEAIQMKAIRSLTSSKFYTHTEPLFKMVNILNNDDLYYILKFCFKPYN